MDLADAIYRALTGLSPRSEPRDTGSQIRAVEAAFGGSRGAAAALGVTQRTWQRWRAGTMRPTRGHAAALALAGRLTRLTPARAARLARANAPHVDWVSLYDGRERSGRFGADARALKWAAGGVQNVIDAWRVGDDQGAAQAFLDAIGDRWYREAIEAGQTGAELGADLRATGARITRLIFKAR